MEHIASFSNGLHGNHLYTSISGYAIDQPLSLTKSSHDVGAGGRERAVIGGPVERQQVCQLETLIKGISDIYNDKNSLQTLDLKCSIGNK